MVVYLHSSQANSFSGLFSRMAFLVMDQSCLCLQRLIACFANILFPPFLSMHCAFVPNDRGGSHLFLADFTLKNLCQLETSNRTSCSIRHTCSLCARPFVTVTNFANNFGEVNCTVAKIRQLEPWSVDELIFAHRHPLLTQRRPKIESLWGKQEFLRPEQAPLS